jgi:hypothetical protein
MKAESSGALVTSAVRIRPPTVDELTNAYLSLNSLQQKNIHSGFSRYIEICRFDARFFEIFANFLCDHFFEFDLRLLQEIHFFDHAWAAVLGVLIEHVTLLRSPRDKKFQRWKKQLTRNLQPASGEIFFIGLFDFNEKRIGQLRAMPCRLFLKWGFYHDEVLVNKAEILNRTTLSPFFRRRLLQAWRKRGIKLDVDSYRARLNYQVSYRQALQDLKSLNHR